MRRFFAPVVLALAAMTVVPAQASSPQKSIAATDDRCPSSPLSLQKALREKPLNQRLPELRWVVGYCRGNSNVPANWTPRSTTELRVLLRDFSLNERYTAMRWFVTSGSHIVRYGKRVDDYGATSLPYNRAEMVELLREFEVSERLDVLGFSAIYGEDWFYYNRRRALTISPRWCSEVTKKGIAEEFLFGDRATVAKRIEAAC